MLLEEKNTTVPKLCRHKTYLLRWQAPA